MARFRRPARAAAVAAVAAAIAIAASPAATDAHTEAAEVSRLLDTNSEHATAAARRAFERHPSDYRVAGLLARALFAERDSRAIDVANRALVLNPNSGESHRLVARMLWHSNRRDQALGEYARALNLAPRGEVLDELLAAFPGDVAAARGLPAEPERVERWVKNLRKRNRGRLARNYVERFLELYPDHVGALLEAANLCAGLGESQVALEYSERARELERTPRTAVTLAASMRGVGQAEQAVRLLTQELESNLRSPTLDERYQLLVALAEAQVAAGDPQGGRSSLRTALDFAQTRSDQARVHRKLAETEELLGNPRQAEWERQTANELTEK